MSANRGRSEGGGAVDLVSRFLKGGGLRVQVEFGVVVAASVLAFGLWAFLEIAENVSDGDTRGIDRVLLLALRNPNDRGDPLGPLWLEETMRDFTALGGVAVLSLLSLAFVAHLVLRGKPRAGGVLGASVFGALVVSLALKHLFARPRPDLVPQLSHVMTTSFPSGHSMLSASVYLTLGALLARLEQRRLLKIHLLSWALLLTALTGFSRVYMGVHWPTDVLAGWAAGAAWASFTWIVTWFLQRRGSIE